MSKERIFQIISQIIFAIFFVALIVFGRVQLWMAIFGVSLILSLFFGRFYCGWICPINTSLRFVEFVKRKLKIKSFKIPKFLKKSVARYIFLALFIGIFVFVMVRGKPLPVLPAVVVLAIILTLFFPENLWHRYLCPYGTILKLPGSKSLFGLQIDVSNCSSCGACQKVCPSDAIVNEDNTYKIKKNECLLCLNCKEKCSKDVVIYQKQGKKEIIVDKK